MQPDVHVFTETDADPLTGFDFATKPSSKLSPTQAALVAAGLAQPTQQALPLQPTTRHRQSGSDYDSALVCWLWHLLECG